MKIILDLDLWTVNRPRSDIQFPMKNLLDKIS
jgi:hypothetical protein